MKRILITTLLIFYMLSLASFGEKVEDDYTILVFMNGSTLESGYNYYKQEFRGNATKDLEEMIAGYKGDDNINIVVETIGTKRWNNDFVDGSQTQRFLLTENGFELQHTMPPQKVGYKKSLSDFITWAKYYYPAKKYGLIMWNHGGGPVYGFGLDEHFEGSRLHLEEMDSALAKAKEVTDIEFEFIGFDACIMSTIEIADMLSPYAKYLLSSEDLEPAHGWNYTTLLKELHIEPTMTGETLGTIMGESYLEEANEKGELYNITFSVIDLSKVDKIVEELDTLITQFNQIYENPSDFYNFSKAVAKSRAVGNNTESQGYSDLIDIIDLSDNLSSYFDISTEPLKNAVKDSILYNLDTSRAQNANGLAIYFPLKDKAHIQTNLTYYMKTGFSQVYKEFITEFQDQMIALTGEGQIEFDINTPNKETDFYHIIFDDEDLDKIAAVYLSVFTVTEDDNRPNHSFVDLGHINDIFYDERHESYNEQFDKEWLFLGEQPLRLRIMSDNENNIEYEAPVIYQDQGMYLMISFDKETETYTLNGLRAGRDPQTGKVDRETYQLTPGDVVTPMYKAYHDKRRHFEWIRGEQITITKDTSIMKKHLQADYFALSFKYYDYSYRSYQTEFFRFER